MRIRIQRRGLVPAAVVAIVGTIVLYLLTTVGLAALRGGETGAGAAARGYLPSVIENAPDTVGTTEEYGAPGKVSLVYAGTDVAQGLGGSVDRPWLTVSATSGEYRALSEAGLPTAGADRVRVSPDGSLLAWTGPDGLVVYDTSSGEVTRTGVDDVDVVGPISADGAHVLVHRDGAAVVDTGSGEVTARADADATAVGGASWRPDGAAVDLVSEDGLVTMSVDGTVDVRDSEIPAGAELAWSPEGDRLADLREVDGNNRLFLSRTRPDGSVAAAEQVEVPGVSLQHLFGFSGDRSVTVDAFLIETGSIERVLDVSLDRGTTTDLTTLPPPGSNWVDTSTLSVATDDLVRGSFEFDPPVWPWSYTSRLTACALFMFFLFGLYVTRRPRER